MLDAVVVEDRVDDRRLDRVGDEPVFLLAVAGLVGVGVGVGFELVAVGGRAAGVPALADALFHAAAALFDQVADVPFGDALFDAAGEDRGRVAGHRLVGRKQPMSRCSSSRSIRVASAVMRESRSMLSTMTASKRVCGGGVQEFGEAAVAGQGEPEGVAVAAVAALDELFAAALDVPVGRDDHAAGSAAVSSQAASWRGSESEGPGRPRSRRVRRTRTSSRPGSSCSPVL